MVIWEREKRGLISYKVVTDVSAYRNYPAWKTRPVYEKYDGCEGRDVLGDTIDISAKIGNYGPR